MQYIKEDVEKMLIEHQKNKSKLTEIQLKREEYQQRLNYAGTVYEDTPDEIIAGMQLGGQTYDGVHSNTNKISDKTYSTAATYHKEERHINKEDILFLKRKLLEYEKIENSLNKKIVRVKNLLDQLSAEEEFIIRVYYMQKAKWDYVSQQYCIEFQKPKSINQLLNIRDVAIKSMLEVLNTGE